MSRKKKFKRVLLCALLISLPLLSMTSTIEHNINSDKVEMCNINDDSILLAKSLEFKNLCIQQKKDSVKDILINEVEEYIFDIAPKTNKNIPMYLVEHALNYNIDLAFMMAQTQIETIFGTVGVGRESSRHSLFGVAIKKYMNYELAINDYCKILKKYYLTHGRTEQHLLQLYVTTSGARYAENPNYEVLLRKAYKTIINNTNIKNLQLKYNVE